MSWWVQILRTATEGTINAPLRACLARAFPNIDLDSAINPHDALEDIAQLRGEAAHDSIIADDRKVRDTEKLRDLVMGVAGHRSPGPSSNLPLQIRCRFPGNPQPARARDGAPSVRPLHHLPSCCIDGTIGFETFKVDLANVRENVK